MSRPLRIPVRAVAAPAETGYVVDKTFPLRNGTTVRISVQQSGAGDQVVRMLTDLQGGRLLLHWGVEGGKDYKGGWRLPQSSGSRPDGTVQYKDRALQSPIRTNKDGKGELLIKLPGDEASDVLNFVLKDDATNTWYDCNGSNFKVSLRSTPSLDEADALSSRGDALPKELCDKWAWVRWDFASRPQRSPEAANEEHSIGVLEMKSLLLKGRSMDELWSVANGQWKYAEYRKAVIKPTLDGAATPQAAQRPPTPSTAALPDDLVNVQAYVLWEQDGRKDGADYSDAARSTLRAQLDSGKGLEEVCAALKFKPDWLSGPASASVSPQQQQQPPPQQQQQQQPEVLVGRKQQKAEVGVSLPSLPTRNALDMIKERPNPPPVLSADKALVPVRPMEFLVQRFAVDPATKWRRVFSLGGKSEMLAVVRQESRTSPIRMDLLTDNAADMILHWGVQPPASRDWLMADQGLWPGNTRTAGHIACETPFGSCSDPEECDVEDLGGGKVPLQRVTITLPADHTLGALCFVMHSADSTMWYKDGSNNFTVPLPSPHRADSLEPSSSASAMKDELSREIVSAEQTSAWTLMHRFNKAADLLQGVMDGRFEGVGMTDAYARIYVWLRYSSTRHLTWQRSYNTQPRILSAAQDRLTVTQAYSRSKGEAAEWARAMLTTVGRGGDGQRIRDEILNIMHRNHISEVKGIWMEEWHQKLHNNTTPDDVPICQAYLAFLESRGNNGAYWRVLTDAGLSRERLEGFDRAITKEPDYYADKRDALIREFNNYLGILKAVHSGADLQASAAAAGNRIPGAARGYLAYVMSNLGSSQVLPFLEAAVEARTELAPFLAGNRELMYLDLSLEDEIRRASERGVGSAGFGAAAFMKPLLQNLCLSLGDNEELCYCLAAWGELSPSVRNGGRVDKEEALLAVAVLNRVRRAISTVSDSIMSRIGEVSVSYGQSFQVENWAVQLFAEEVVRGGPAFAVSLAISNIEPGLRNAAALGAWQVISPVTVTGVVEIVKGLHEVQDKVYDVPTVLLAEQVTGEEEIPEGVVALITPDAPDVLSHVSVRARNMKVLFATCHDEAPPVRDQGAQGQEPDVHHHSLRVRQQRHPMRRTGVAEAQAACVSLSRRSCGSGAGALPSPQGPGIKIEVPQWCGKWVVGMDAYADGVVGGKSKNLALLRGKLPDWIRLPPSITLPFGCFEQALEEASNAHIKQGLRDLVSRLTAKPHAEGGDAHSSGGGSGGVGGGGGGGSGGAGHESAASILAECRKLAMGVTVPANVRGDLTAMMKAAGV
ncbi:MAG: hypothetical protein WDW38_001561 [Sanguina aurantia]